MTMIFSFLSRSLKNAFASSTINRAWRVQAWIQLPQPMQSYDLWLPFPRAVVAAFYRTRGDTGMAIYAPFLINLNDRRQCLFFHRLPPKAGSLIIPYVQRANFKIGYFEIGFCNFSG
jgi:hypothetical protein